MRIPESLLGLLDLGIIDEIERSLMSGKEAQVFLVVLWFTNPRISIVPNRSSIDQCQIGDIYSLKAGSGDIN